MSADEPGSPAHTDQYDVLSIKYLSRAGDSFKYSTADRVGAGKDDDLWIRNSIVTYLQGFRHILSDGTCNDNTIGMTW